MRQPPSGDPEGGFSIGKGVLPVKKIVALLMVVVMAASPLLMLPGVVKAESEDYGIMPYAITGQSITALSARSYLAFDSVSGGDDINYPGSVLASGHFMIGYRLYTANTNKFLTGLMSFRNFGFVLHGPLSVYCSGKFNYSLESIYCSDPGINMFLEPFASGSFTVSETGSSYNPTYPSGTALVGMVFTDVVSQSFDLIFTFSFTLLLEKPTVSSAFRSFMVDAYVTPNVMSVQDNLLYAKDQSSTAGFFDQQNQLMQGWTDDILSALGELNGGSFDDSQITQNQGVLDNALGGYDQEMAAGEQAGYGAITAVTAPDISASSTDADFFTSVLSSVMSLRGISSVVGISVFVGVASLFTKKRRV